jgi:hypothetical protein
MTGAAGAWNLPPGPFPGTIAGQAMVGDGESPRRATMIHDPVRVPFRQLIGTPARVPAEAGIPAPPQVPWQWPIWTFQWTPRLIQDNACKTI